MSKTIKTIKSFNYQELSKNIEVTEDPNEYGALIMIELYNKIKEIYRKSTGNEGKIDVDPRKIIMNEDELEKLLDDITEEYSKKETLGIYLSWMNQGPSARDIEKDKIILKEGYMIPSE